MKLTPTTDTDLSLATYRGGSHFTSDIFKNKADKNASANLSALICTVKYFEPQGTLKKPQNTVPNGYLLMS